MSTKEQCEVCYCTLPQHYPHCVSPAAIREKEFYPGKVLEVAEAVNGVATFEGGGVRIVVPEATEQICPTAILKVAEIYAEGEAKYGAYNWAKSFPRSNLFRHLLRHLLLWRKGDRSEPHLAKVLWGIITLIHYEENCHCERTFD